MERRPVHVASVETLRNERDVVPELPGYIAVLGEDYRASRIARRRSSGSWVPIDFFDPEGVNELRRNTSVGHSSHTAEQHAIRHASHQKNNGDDSTIVSEAEGPDRFDLEQTLKDLVRRGQDPYHRELGVVFQDLRVQCRGTATTYQSTISSALNPVYIIEKIRSLMHPPIRNIISGFEGVVNPGEMLLVLGRPGAGCSTLLKALSNQHDEYYDVSGLLRFSCFTPEQIHKYFRGDVIYCPEDDVHFPLLTVGQTLNFATRTRMPSKKTLPPDMTPKQLRDEIVNILTTVFGLRHAKNTKVGNAAIRGVSGGERKRVSLAEALATRALLGAWDNSTRGLDSSTALEFVRGLRIATDTMGLTSIVSIYQASELLYELFDKVCLIYEGRMVYFGPAHAAGQYFIDQGWEPANRQTTPDFLVAVTDPGGRTPRQGFEDRVPRTAAEMVAAFQRHPLAEENKREIASFLADNVNLDPLDHDELTSKGFPNVPRAPEEEKELKRTHYIQSAQAEHAKRARRKSPYTISVASQIRETVIRKVQILRADWLAQVINIVSYIVVAIIIGTMFHDMDDVTSLFFSRGGVLFFCILFCALNSMAEIPALYSQRPIVNRHAKAAMYHPFAETVALTLVDIPITLVTLLFFSVLLYFLVGLQRTAGQFFIFYLFLVSISLLMKAFFRMLTAAFKRESGATGLGSAFLLAFVIYTGFTIPEPTMVAALEWIKYINPMRYGFEGIMANEFNTIDATCSQLVPSGLGYENITLANQVCTAVGSVPGQPTVDGSTYISLAYNYSRSRLWRNFGIMIAFLVGLFALQMFVTEKNTSNLIETAVTLFKRRSKKPRITETTATDEEKGQMHIQDAKVVDESINVEDHSAAAPRMTDIFSWQNIRYTVPVGKGETRLLLDNVSGYVVPGKLTALMGESGAGKTTLLNVLAGRTDTGVVLGDRLVNGQALPHDFQAQTAYCQQMDTHVPETTVREALLFSAKLRQPSSVPLSEKEAYVETCLKMCGLESHADAIVGTLNVEFKKRTTIGVELAARPRLLLFLDEPTSGLDSQSAWAIMKFLRSLADYGQAILCTIHQPSSELFQVFDRLLLLQKGGQTVYFGDLGMNSSTLIDYFERNGARKCEAHENPAEWMLDVIGAGATATSAIDWHGAWNKSNEAAKFKVHLDGIHSEGRQRPAIGAIQKSEFATSWFYQLYELTIRAYQIYWRRTDYIFWKQFLNVAGGLLIGFTFFDVGDSIQDTLNQLFTVFLSTILAVGQADSMLVEYINIRNVYEVRERPSRIYSWTAMVTSLFLVEIPWNILGSALYYFCWYWTVGFDTSRAGYTFLVLAVAFPLWYATLAQAVAAMSPDAIVGSLLFSNLFTIVAIFCGVLQPYAQLGWWKWMYRVSPFTYLIEGLVGQATGKQSINCSAVEFAILEPPSGMTCSQFMSEYIQRAGGYLGNPDATSACEFCAYRTTDEFLQKLFNISYDNRWRDVGLLFVYSCFNIIVTFIFMYLFRIRSRR